MLTYLYFIYLPHQHHQMRELKSATRWGKKWW